MRKLLTIIAFASLCACNSSGTPHAAAPKSNVVVKTVDQQNNEFKAEKVTWSYLNKRETRHALNCAEDLCSEWAVGSDAAGSIAITAYASKVKVDDEYCWDLFEGEAVIHANPTIAQEVIIVLSKTVTACK